MRTDCGLECLRLMMMMMHEAGRRCNVGAAYRSQVLIAHTAQRLCLGII